MDQSNVNRFECPFTEKLAFFSPERQMWCEGKQGRKGRVQRILDSFINMGLPLQALPDLVHKSYLQKESQLQI
jgi:hypothetical protein